RASLREDGSDPRETRDHGARRIRYFAYGRRCPTLLPDCPTRRGSPLGVEPEVCPMPSLDLATLTAAVDGGAAAIRTLTRLVPAGGPGDKVFPPTYVKERNATTKYAIESRRLDGREVQTVLLDSVASQANRFELALLEGWRRGELPFPVVA